MYGIWNGVEKRFVFGIQESTKQEAWRKFIKAVGKTGYKWRFDIRTIPPGFRNPKNQKYAHYERRCF